ncbi:MAG TPA: glycoside hydrolase family 9 protein, partial [Longimicrobiaceae bacterium]
AAGAFGPCAATFRLDFSVVRAPGAYRLRAAGMEARVRIGAGVYRGAADTLLAYMRQQRSGFNPFFRDSVHARTDGILVDHPTRAGEFIPVAGGWADAADYLQYVTTSATATFALLMAYRDHPRAFGDGHRADGLPGANGVPDVLDEARHGLEWLLRMYPEDGLLLNQLGDDRDHAFPDLPTTDSSDYGWGKGGFRPVYPCTGRPQGLFRYRNGSTGLASTAGKFASAFALASRLYARRDPAFAAVLRRRAEAAYALGKAHPGVCQTAPGRAPYFYEEENWVDDMELAAAELAALTGDRHYLADAVVFARTEPVTPWMGRDTARHYQWYPWHNAGHHEAWRLADARTRRELAEFYRRGLAAVARRADNGFRVGVPFIWCSNDLMASFATQALLYRRMTGDGSLAEYEAAAVDWLFGANPWGVSMVIGLPSGGTWARDPHSVIAKELGVRHTGALLDGPVYRSIFQNLKGIRLHEPDEYAAFNTGHVVYHDDLGDYSTNEPITDGTANLAYVLAALGGAGWGQGRARVDRRN